ncbi:MAG: cyclase family protein [Nitrospinota bacterium]|jgi:kynurenine formamidase|nr:cyclase family protein [Nitrospinota bacterium]MDP7386823.1 cyclase family protein [Nitrospinota bacterium]
MPRIIDLSMEVHRFMQTYPGTVSPLIRVLENHHESAARLNAEQYGADTLFNHCVVVLSDHHGTHIDSVFHGDPEGAPAEQIPLEHCYGPGVVLDLSHKKGGEAIEIADLEAALARIDYALKPRDIVLLRTDASKKSDRPEYLTDHPGMIRESCEWLLDRGIKTIGIDTVGFDLPIPKMFERGDLWPCHRLYKDREYWHVENLSNLEAIPAPFGFTVSLLPVKWKGASGAPIRAVAIID